MVERQLGGNCSRGPPVLHVIFLTAVTTAEHDVSITHKQINKKEFDVKKHQRGPALSFQYSVTSGDVGCHLPHSLALWPFDLSWIFFTIAPVKLIMLLQQQKHLYVVVKLEMSHTREQCEKNCLCLCHINRFVPSSPLSHTHMITHAHAHALGFAHTPTHTYMRTDVAFEGFDVGDASVSTLSCGETFHLIFFFRECSEHELFCQNDGYFFFYAGIESVVSNKGLHPHPHPHIS